MADACPNQQALHRQQGNCCKFCNSSERDAPAQQALHRHQSLARAAVDRDADLREAYLKARRERERGMLGE